MSTVDYIIAIDPSGNWNEGKGTTGIAVLDIKKDCIILTDIITANKSECPEDYFMQNVLRLDSLIASYPNHVVRVEDYLVYGSKATSQINSHMETPQLIGILRYHLYCKGIKTFLRPASSVKNRWTDDILVHYGYLAKVNNKYCLANDILKKPLTLHERDAIRHAVACKYFDITEK